MSQFSVQPLVKTKSWCLFDSDFWKSHHRLSVHDHWISMVMSFIQAQKTTQANKVSGFDMMCVEWITNVVGRWFCSVATLQKHADTDRTSERHIFSYSLCCSSFINISFGIWPKEVQCSIKPYSMLRVKGHLCCCTLTHTDTHSQVNDRLSAGDQGHSAVWPAGQNCNPLQAFTFPDWVVQSIPHEYWGKYEVCVHKCRKTHLYAN